MIEFTLLESFGWRGTRDNDVKILRAKFQHKIVERLNDAYNPRNGS